MVPYGMHATRSVTPFAVVMLRFAKSIAFCLTTENGSTRGLVTAANEHYDVRPLCYWRPVYAYDVRLT